MSSPAADSSPLRVASLIARDIKLAHSVFALPFAVLGAFLAFAQTDPRDWRRFVGQLALVIACMVFARTWAMLVNRLLDRSIDARHERTKRRAFASGALAPGQGWLVALASAAAFLACCAAFVLAFGNPWPVYLGAPVLAWIALYSLTKRFTALCHVWLGISLAIAPLAAALAVHPPALGHPALHWMFFFVVQWVAGFDVIYALQDQHFDRANRLSSIPARVGTSGSILVARALHGAAAVALFQVWRSHPSFGALFAAGGLIVVGLLVWEHVILTRLATRSIGPRGDDTDNPPPALNIAFFTLNGVVSCVLGVSGVVDLLA